MVGSALNKMLRRKNLQGVITLYLKVWLHTRLHTLSLRSNGLFPNISGGVFLIRIVAEAKSYSSDLQWVFPLLPHRCYIVMRQNNCAKDDPLINTAATSALHPIFKKQTSSTKNLCCEIGTLCWSLAASFSNRAPKAFVSEINIPLCNKSTSGEKRVVAYLKPYIMRANGLSLSGTTEALHFQQASPLTRFLLLFFFLFNFRHSAYRFKEVSNEG